jgi:hypothetical protein
MLRPAAASATGLAVHAHLAADAALLLLRHDRAGGRLTLLDQRLDPWTSSLYCATPRSCSGAATIAGIRPDTTIQVEYGQTRPRHSESSAGIGLPRAPSDQLQEGAATSVQEESDPGPLARPTRPERSCGLAPWRRRRDDQLREAPVLPRCWRRINRAARCQHLGKQAWTPARSARP